MGLTRLPLPSTHAGQSSFINVHHFGPTDGQKVYIQAGLHADEHPGLLVAQYLLEELATLEKQNKLHAHFVVVPFANPIGLGQRTFGHLTGRCDWHTGQNFNRGMGIDREAFNEAFVAQLTDNTSKNDELMRTTLKALVDSRAPGYEIESLHKLLLSQSIDAHYVIDLHCDIVALPHVFYGAHQHEDGQLLARCLNFPVCLEEDVRGTVAFDGTHTQPWVLSEQRAAKPVFKQPCFAATVELRGNTDVSRELAAQDCAGLLSFFSAKGLINHPAVEPHPKVEQITVGVDQVKLVTATVPGIVTYNCQLNEFVKKGDKIAEIVLIDQETPAHVDMIASSDGLLFSQTNEFYVAPGQIIAMLATQEQQNKVGNQLAF